MIGLGCVRADPGETERAVRSAIERGMRLVDTASVYENETEVGAALRSASVPRADVFVSTKVWNSDLGYDRTLKAFDRSLAELGVEYIDLYMIHWPLIRLRRESWNALRRLLGEGRCRAIGVCNFAPHHITEIAGETGVIPAVNQVEFNPFLNQGRLHEWCRRKDILVQTNRPFSKPGRLRDRRLQETAERYRKSTAQLVVRWALQKDVAVLLRSSDPERIAECADVFDFEISLPDMDTLDSLHQNARVSWDPSRVP